MCNSVFMRWRNFGMFAAPPKGCYWHCEFVPVFLHIWKASCILCVTSIPVIVYYSSTFGDNSKRSRYLPLETAMKKFTIMFIVCFIRAAEFSAASLFLQTRLRALAEDGRPCASEEAPAPIPCEMRASIIKPRLLLIIRNCAVDIVAAILACARAGEFVRTAPDCLGWFLNDFADATSISSPELQAKSLKRELRGDVLLGVVPAKITSHSIDEFRNVDISQEYAETLWARY